MTVGIATGILIRYKYWLNIPIGYRFISTGYTKQEPVSRSLTDYRFRHPGATGATASEIEPTTRHALSEACHRHAQASLPHHPSSHLES
jgi:hypothetical protein